MSQLQKLIDKFLLEPRKSKRGGWADITKYDVTLLREIIYELITLKCEKDADGDVPIEFIVINRRTHRRLSYLPLMYREQKTDDPDVVQIVPFMDYLRSLMSNLRQATDDLNNAYHSEGFQNGYND